MTYSTTKPIPSRCSISNREQEVLLLVAHECTTHEIAKKLFISTHTAISHRKNLMDKLQVKNTAGMVRRAFELGLLKVQSGIQYQVSNLQR